MAQLSLALRWGYSDGTSIKVVACSLSPANVTITVDGNDTLLSGMTALGTVSPVYGTEAMFTDSGTVSNLTANTLYSYTATQGANTITGTFRTAPEASNDFSVFFGTCDNAQSIGGLAPGMYQHIRTYAQSGALPVAAIVHIDDHYGYLDLGETDDSAGTGHRVTGPGEAYTTAKVYDYAVNAAASLGLYQNAADPYVSAGHDTDRQWVFQNIPVWPQWGDHDAGANDMGWSIDPAVAGLTQFTNCKAVWDAVLAPLQPPNIDAGSNAWGANLGCLYVAAMDGITNGGGGGNNTTAPSTLFGNTQIDNVLAAMANSQPFKLLGLANGIRYLTATQSNQGGAQYPISLHASEYARLFTDSTGLMGLPETNGKFGTLITMHGDYHGLKFQKNENTSGTLDEWFYSINLGTLTGAINFKRIDDADVTASGVTVEYSDGPDVHGNSNDYWAVRLDVYGSRSPKELHVHMMDSAGADVFSRKFVHQTTGNECVPVGNSVFNRVVSTGSLDE